MTSGTMNSVGLIGGKIILNGNSMLLKTSRDLLMLFAAVTHLVIIIIQFNSIHVYLHANLTAQMPITKLARERRKRQQTKNLQKM
jgi:hypothetical protein